MRIHQQVEYLMDATIDDINRIGRQNAMKGASKNQYAKSDERQKRHKYVEKIHDPGMDTILHPRNLDGDRPYHRKQHECSYINGARPDRTLGHIWKPVWLSIA